MDTDHILPYVIKAKSYGTRVLIVSETEEIELAKSLASAGLEVRMIQSHDIILKQNPEYRPDLVWAHTVIFFGVTCQIDSGVVFNLLSKNKLSESGWNVGQGWT